jgi:phosphoglucosamine mutase
MARHTFGTDGVRGIVGEQLTVDLVERLGRAFALWSGGGRTVIGRDTRGSGPELEQALARGIASGGGSAVVGGVLPTPAVALLAHEDLAAVVTASHNPPEYNGVKLFGRGGQKLVDADEEAIEALLAAPATGGGSIEPLGAATDIYIDLVLERFGGDLTGLAIGVDCANGAFAGSAPGVFERLGARVVAIGNAPDGTNINAGCGATDLALLARTVREQRLDLGIAFDGDGDRLLAVTAEGEPIDGDQIVAILAPFLGVDQVAVTVMSNLGLHRYLAAQGIRVHTTAVGDRYVLEALRREGGSLGAEQSGHVIVLDGHVTGDGLAAALLLCRALEGRTLAAAAAAMPRFPQLKLNLPSGGKALSQGLYDEIAALNARLAGSGRVLVRPSGTEPLVRILAEAESQEMAADLCGTVEHLVRQELG